MQLLGASSISLWYSVASQCLRASKHLLFSFLNQSDIQRGGHQLLLIALEKQLPGVSSLCCVLLRR